MREYCTYSADPVGRLVLGDLRARRRARARRDERRRLHRPPARQLPPGPAARPRARPRLPARRRTCAASASRTPTSPGRCTEPVAALLALRGASARAGSSRRGCRSAAALGGRPGLSVALFARGGLAALDALERAGWDVFTGRPRRAGRPSRRLALRELVRRMNVEEAYAEVARASRAARRATSPGASASCRARSGARSRRSTRSPARVDDIADGACRRRARGRELGGCRRRRLRSRTSPDGRRRARRARRRARPLSDPAAARSTTSSTAALMDLERTRYASWEELREYCRRVAGAVGRRLHRRLRPEPTRAARRSPRRSASRSSRSTSCATSPRTGRSGASTCPQDELAALRRHRGRHRRGPLRARLARADGAPGCARARRSCARGSSSCRSSTGAARSAFARSPGIYRGAARPDASARDYDVFTRAARTSRRSAKLRAVAGAVRGGASCGGGLAGLAAALELVDARARSHAARGAADARRRGADAARAGGRPDPAARQRPAHRARLLHRVPALPRPDRAGRLGCAARRLALPVIAEDGRVATIGAGPLALAALPPPAAPRPARESRASRAGWARSTPDDHDDETFARLLRRLGSPQAAIDRFWDVFIRPALNLPARGGERRARRLHRADGAARRPAARATSSFRVAPLGEMHGEAAGARSPAAGARCGPAHACVELGAGRGRRSQTASGRGRRVRRRGSAGARAPALLGEPAPALEDSPIVSVHLLFDRRPARTPLAALLGSPAHWVFDRGASHRPRARAGPVPDGRLERRARAARAARAGARRADGSAS